MFNSIITLLVNYYTQNPILSIVILFFSPTFLLMILYPIGVQSTRTSTIAKLFYPITIPVVILALILDVIANYTSLALLTLDFPMKGEYTFSTRMDNRLVFNTNWLGTVSRAICKVLNWFTYPEKHIKNA